jgi:ATP-dependent Clp protease ATP-binding subunit ClpX
VNVPPQGGRKHPEQKMIPVDTKHILFIAGGAFDGIERKIAQRLNTKVIGYGAQKKADEIDRNNLVQYVAPQDLKAFGMIPEIVGRLPVIAHLNPLDRDALRQILTEPKNSIIKQYVKLFQMDHVKITFDPEVLDYIVSLAIEFKLGARGLRSICESIMIDVMYENPTDKQSNIRITKSLAEQKISKITANRLKAG